MWQELTINQPSTRRQREEIDYQADCLRIPYQVLMEATSKEIGRRVTDLGQLHHTEATQVLKLLNAGTLHSRHAIPAYQQVPNTPNPL